MSQPSVLKTAQGPQVGPYVFGKTLGTGSTGKVKLARNLKTGETVAIKIVRKDFLDRKPSLKKKMRREISVLKLLNHPNVMALIDVFEIDTHLFLVMEYVDGLELFEFLVRRGKLPPNEALGFFHQIICGLEYCHHRLICHRDLKPENLLLDRQLNVKIADFGMTSLNVPGSLLETSCGSPHYCDPMVVSGDRYDGLKADWSCGVILYAMVTGRLPFDDDNIQRLLMKVQAGHFHMPHDLPESLQNLIQGMLTVDPMERITIDEIKAHPWFNTFPPRYYPVDTFEAPSDPVLSPDPRVLASLADLGWGDVGSIADKLAQPDASMEKVFYDQLSRHRMFSKPSSIANLPHVQAHVGAPAGMPPASSSVPVGTAPNPVRAEEGAGEPTNDAGTLANQVSGLAVDAKDTSHRVPSSVSWPGVRESSDNSDSRAAPGSNSTVSESTGNQPKGLVRQSQLIRSATEHTERTEDDNIETAIETGGGAQKSWFESVRDMWSWQGKEGDQGDAREDTDATERAGKADVDSDRPAGV